MTSVAFEAAFEFPDYFGRNWDAVADCLGDLGWLQARGFVLIIDDVGSCGVSQAFGRLLQIWLSAAQEWSAEGTPFHLVGLLAVPAIDVSARLGSPRETVPPPFRHQIRSWSRAPALVEEITNLASESPYLWRTEPGIRGPSGRRRRPHVRTMAEAAVQRDDSELAPFLELLDEAYENGGGEVQELISVSFLEHLPRLGEPGSELRARLGPAMTAQMSVID
jgi:RNAse (barnase) inhibitor barstar